MKDFIIATILLVATLILTSCGSHTVETRGRDTAASVPPKAIIDTFNTNAIIPEVLRPMLAEFRFEMEGRGVIVDYSRIQIRIGAVFSGSKGGETYYNPITKFTEINLIAEYTQCLVYHELGHAVLHLPHSDGVMDIMNADWCQSTITDDMLDRMAEQAEKAGAAK